MNKLTRFSLRAFTPYRISFRTFTDRFKDKEAAEEKVYINKQEMSSLQKLLKKIKTEQNVNHEKEEECELRNILKKHNVTDSEALVSELKNWKEGHH